MTELTSFEHIVVTRSLTRRFHDLVAVNEVSLAVAPGEIFGLLGPNGAGKTTLIKILTTLLPPTSGTALVAGFDVQRDPDQVRRVIGYVPQMISVDGDLTGYENLQVFARLYEVPRPQRRQRIEEALRTMELVEAGHKLVREYSGGMIRRLEIAEAVLHQPILLFLDEPTVGLDPIARETVWEHVEQLRTDHGTTILLTTHYMDEAEQLCDRVAVMHLGRIAAIGTPEELKASLRRPDATLDDVFEHYAGGAIEAGGTFREAVRARRTLRRLG
ncbi:MAG TPA: ATP-binding cassette domain-containing protein [Candidatus Dormibacteraeota bacterium]|jgi:ABC-2 type transport system ATP-binding protein|nr:ATP-binding cassette domain-containing protein [Candidatus Dormibacteraeota bacterium]